MGRLYSKSAPWKFLALPLIVYVGIVLVPIFMTLVYSFTDWNITNEKNFIGLTNYIRMFQDSNFLLALKNNLLYVLIDVIFEVIFGLFMAILLTELPRRISNFIKIVYFIPCIISSIAVAETVKRMVSMVPQGVINAFLQLIGLGSLQGAFAADPKLAIYVVALADVYKWSGLYMVIYFGALISVPSEAVDAARIDGASKIQEYFYVRLPMIRNIIVTTVILITTGSLKVFEMPFVLTKGGPGYASQVLSTYMYMKSFSGLEFGYGSAISIFQALLCMTAMVLLRFVIFRKNNME